MYAMSAAPSVLSGKKEMCTECEFIVSLRVDSKKKRLFMIWVEMFSFYLKTRRKKLLVNHKTLDPHKSN